MYVGNTFFACPYPKQGGDPNCFQPDWLHRVVVHVAGLGRRKPKLPKVLTDNPWFEPHLEFVRAVNRGLEGAQLVNKFPTEVMIDRWVTGDVEYQRYRRMLEALLLSPGTIEQIAADVQHPVEVIQQFVRVYFDIRDDSFQQPRSEIMRRLIALMGNDELPENAPPTMQWRVQAAQPMGYLMISTHFGLSGAKIKAAERFAEMQKLSQAYLTQRLLSGNMRPEDAIAIAAQGQSQEQFELAAGQAAGDSAAWGLIAGMLGLVRPQLAALVGAEASQRAAINQQLQSRMAAERTIEATVVEDKGPGAGMDDLNARLHTQVQNADK